MKPGNLATSTVECLVDFFASLAIEQSRAIDDDEYTEYHELYRTIQDVDREISLRGTAARRELLRLYGHENIQVRLQAVLHAFALEPVLSRQVLEEIRAHQIQPYAMDAGMALWNLDRGVFKPD